MKKIGVGVGLAFLVSIVGLAQSGGAAADDVLRAQRAAGDAMVKKDRAAMEQLFADDYTYIHSNGRVQAKAQDIVENLSPELKWTADNFADLKARVYGEAAIVTGAETLVGAAKNYAPGPRRITDVWVKRNGRWQSAGGISTVVSKDDSEHAATSAMKDLKAKGIAGATSDQRAALQAEDAYAKADAGNDDAKSASLQTKDFSFVTRTGAVASPNAPPPNPIKSMTVAYGSVRTYGALAVIQGSLLWSDVKGFSPGVLRFQRVWVKEGGAWKLAAEQRTPIAAARPTT
jgi:hypothetical protein